MRSIKLIITTIAILTFIVSCQQIKKPETRKQEKQVVKTKVIEFDQEQYLQAALEGNLSIIQKGLEAGLDVDAVDENGFSALTLASYNGHNEIINFLLQKGASVNLPNKNRRTALMLASSGPFNETVKILLNAGANPNIVDNIEQFSALMFASAEGQLEVVKTLVENGADRALKDIDGDTAYDFAIKKGHTNVADFLKK